MLGIKNGRRPQLDNTVRGSPRPRDPCTNALLRGAGITDVQIVRAHGVLSDHYNPVTKKLAGIVKLRLTAVFDAQHGGFATGWSSVSWGLIDELFVNLTVPDGGPRRAGPVANGAADTDCAGRAS